MRCSLESLLVALSISLSLGAAFSDPAAAAGTDPKCQPVIDVRKIMADEHQRLVVLANRGTDDISHLNSQGKPTSKFNAQLYYYNPENQTGYIVSADKPLNEPPTCETIEMKLEDVKLFDARIDGLDPLARINGDRSLALQECALLKTNIATCFHNDYLQKLRREQNFNVYFQGSVHDGKGQKLTLVGSAVPGGAGGTEWLSSPEGATIPSATFDKVLYAPKGGEILEQRQRKQRGSPNFP